MVSDTLPDMEAWVVRDGILDAEPVPLDQLGRTAAGLGDGAWLWVDDVDPDAEALERLQTELDLHDLAIEDVQHRNQRPKIEFYPAHLFAVFRPLSCGADELIESELFVFASPAFLVTLRVSPAFDLVAAVKRWPVLAQLAPGTGAALYAVADEIVDNYLEVVDLLEDQADDLEERVFRQDHEVDDRAELQLTILRLRRDAVRLRRHAVPTRQAIDRLADDSPVMNEQLVPYVRDVTDHLLRVIELTDGVREILTTTVDIRMAQSANQLNEVMKKLTAWAAIVLVPTLIAGIYGMNFDHMPELHWVMGYPMALALMAGSALALYVGFHKRGWL
jgi:magnesium transporter